jgi:hypothetical protein
MVIPTRSVAGGARAVLLALLLALGWGCATGPGGGAGYEYFATPAASDPWSRKIQRWQQRERFDRGDDRLVVPGDVAEPGVGETEDAAAAENLQEKYEAFRAMRRRAMAREIADWIQSQAHQHYVPDGPIDRWATLGETLRQNGDDCDGLELLTYNLLRDLGFRDEVFRAIVYRRSDGQHHMVTMWFEDPEDPWVIDPTGAMTSGMPRMSEVPGWVPLKVFGEDEDFTVEQHFIAQTTGN